MDGTSNLGCAQRAALAFVADRQATFTAIRRDMGAEDFAFMLQARPGCHARLGQGPASGTGGCWLHNTRYDFNDAVIPLGAGFLAALAEQRMPLPAR